MTGSDILKQADKIITGHRTVDYGKAENNFGIIADLWSTYLGRAITPGDVSTMMILFKCARIATAQGQPTLDCYIDICGYAALGGQMIPEQEENSSGE
ncbi:MAG: DUF6378 domain-containing protein [Bilifractor sp.]